MAFPPFESSLHDQRMRNLQDRERNFFENVGLESTWVIELLPDQPFDLSRVSDVRVWFQYEALFDENLKRVLQAKRFAGRRDMAALPVATLLREKGEMVDFSGVLTLRTTRALFEGPAIEKTIVDVGLAVRLKNGKPFSGKAKIEIAFEGATAVTVTTNDSGVVATATDHPAGTGLAALATMVQGKSVAGTWIIRLVSLPAGIVSDDLDEVFLMLQCEYGS
jgi:hypothetical protein